MRVVRGDPSSWTMPGPTAITIGVYDGLHVGHRAVVGAVLDLAASADLEPVVVTFDVHPLSVVAPDRAPLALTTVEQRLDLLDGLGVPVAAVLPFSTVRTLDADSFAADVIAGSLRAGAVVVGEDFRFGRNRSGDVEVLAALGERLGFSTVATALVGDGDAISSTRIRGLIADGAVEDAAALLARPHELRGQVVRGEGRGASIGFPTANLAIPAGLVVPGNGVYAAMVGIGSAPTMPAVVNVGVRPTFGGGERTVEAHILDAHADLYEQELRVAFLHRLRAERRFDSVEELIAQIGRDADEARGWLTRHH